MTGKELRTRLKESPLSLAEISRKMHISTQLLNKYFAAEDVRTGTLERLCQALEVPITWFYSGTELVLDNPRTSDNTLRVLADELEKKNAQIDRLLGIIESMQGAKSKRGIA